jgi:hypothetical protein
MIKEIPILFSTEMVQAILDGRKTITRRTNGLNEINKLPDEWTYNKWKAIGPHILWKHQFFNKTSQDYYWDGICCPYGMPRDLLWVREEHYRYGQWVEKEGVFTKTGRQKWQFIPHFDEIKFSDNPPMEFRKGMHHKDPHHVGWYKRLARFMPKAAARIWLEVTDIRVDRLQEITEGDAIAEGVERSISGNGLIVYKHYLKPKYGPSSIHSFETLWTKINGPESWKANPWVWVVSFKKAKK